MKSPRTLLAPALVVCLYVVCWVLVSGPALLVGWLVVDFVQSSRLGPVSGISMGIFYVPCIVIASAAVIPVFAAVVRGLLVVARPPDVPFGSVPLCREDAPELWNMVSELAAEIGVPAPERIWLTSEANAAVGEETRLHGFSVDTRRMYLGMPLLVGLTIDELRAVLCHELGHFARGHTRFGAVIYQGSVTLAAIRENVAGAKAASGLVRYFSGSQSVVLFAYAWLYDAISLKVRRRQEFEADEAAASVAGPDVAGQALRATHVLAATWDHFRTRFLRPMGSTGLWPDDPFSAFETMFAGPDYREMRDRWWLSPPEPPRSWLNSHPSLDRRLARLATDTNGAAAEDGPRAVTLLADRQKLSHRLRKAARRSASGVLSWQDWLSAVAEHNPADTIKIEPAKRGRQFKISDIAVAAMVAIVFTTFLMTIIVGRR